MVGGGCLLSRSQDTHLSEVVSRCRGDRRHGQLKMLVDEVTREVLLGYSDRAVVVLVATAGEELGEGAPGSDGIKVPAAWGGSAWEKRVRSSARVKAGRRGASVLVTGAAGFVGSHVAGALKRRGDGVLGLDSFNDYYEPSLKRVRQAVLERAGVFVVEGDINDGTLLWKLFDVVPFTHVLHLAAQAGVRYAMRNPSSYVHSNVAGLVSVLEAAKSSSSAAWTPASW